jgi:predicted component of type VI protein secretion system
VKYRLEQLVEHDMAYIDWRDNPETRTPTAYYTLTTRGEYVSHMTRTVQDLFQRDPEEIDREDIYTLVDELQQTRLRVDGLSQQLLELEERLEQQEEENDDEGGTTGFGPR